MDAGVRAKSKLIIWGASGPALVVEDILTLQGEYKIFGYLDNINPQRKGESFGGANVLGGEEQLDQLLVYNVRNIIFAFADSKAKLKLSNLVKSKGFELVSAIHPTASVARTAVIGSGTIVRAQVAIGPRIRLGENCLIGYGATISHNCEIDEAVHISSCVNLQETAK